MGKVYKLNSEKSLAHQVLEYAGWYEGRKVDVEKIIEYYQKNNYILNDFAKKFLQEFSGIKENWFFKYIGKNGEVIDTLPLGFYLRKEFTAGILNAFLNYKNG